MFREKFCIKKEKPQNVTPPTWSLLLSWGARRRCCGARSEGPRSASLPLRGSAPLLPWGACRHHRGALSPPAVRARRLRKGIHVWKEMREEGDGGKKRKGVADTRRAGRRNKCCGPRPRELALRP